MNRKSNNQINFVYKIKLQASMVIYSLNVIFDLRIILKLIIIK